MPLMVAKATERRSNGVTTPSTASLQLPSVRKTAWVTGTAKESVEVANDDDNSAILVSVREDDMIGPAVLPTWEITSITAGGGL